MRIWFVALAAAALSLAATAFGAEDEPSVLVKTEAIVQRRLANTLVGYGIITTEPDRVTTVSFPYPVFVSALHASPGQAVARGEPLLEVDTDPAATLAYQQAANAVDYTRGEARRAEQLANEQLATQSQVEAARKALADAEQQLRVQERLGTAARATTFVAPFAGVVIAISVAQGDRLVPGAPMLRLARIDRLRARLGVEPDDAATVRAGMSVRIVSAFGERSAVEAKVTQVQAMLNPQSQLVDVVVSFANRADARLFPGTRVRGEITVGEASGTVVPGQAVLRDGRGDYLFQVKGGRAHRVDVSTGIESQGLVMVSGPLDPAGKVVVLGNYELSDGTKVREAQP